MEQSSSLFLTLSFVKVSLMGQNKLICQNSSLIKSGHFLLIYVSTNYIRQTVFKLLQQDQLCEILFCFSLLRLAPSTKESLKSCL